MGDPNNAIVRVALEDVTAIQIEEFGHLTKGFFDVIIDDRRG
jgi:hypothetical protein